MSLLLSLIHVYASVGSKQKSISSFAPLFRRQHDGKRERFLRGALLTSFASLILRKPLRFVNSW
jgi:hypothetical protein